MANPQVVAEPLAPALGERAPDGTAVAGVEQAEAPHAAIFGLLEAPWFISASMLVVFAIIVWKKVPAAIGKALDKKIDSIREQLAEAENLRKEAEALKAEYAAKAAAAEGDAEAILKRARQEADSILAQAKSDAELLVERRGRMAEEKIASEERAAIDQLRASTAEAARAAAARIISQTLDSDSDERLIDDAINGIGSR